MRSTRKRFPPVVLIDEAALVERRDVGDLRRGSDFVRRDLGVARLGALADQRDAERRAVLEALGDQLLIARLEDVQIQHRAGEEDGVEREEP